MKDNYDKEMQKFGEELAKFLLPYLNDKDSLMIAAVMMKVTMELYTKSLSDDAIHSLLEIVASSVSDIRERETFTVENKTIH